MEINSSTYNTNPSFGIKVSKVFQKAAHNYFNGVEYNHWKSKAFDKKVRFITDEFGYNEFTIEYEKSVKGIGTEHKLFAKRDGMEPVLIAQKDRFRKLLEKFQRITKGELYIKIKQAKQQQGIK